MKERTVWKKIVAMAVCLGLLIIIGIIAIYLAEYQEGKEKSVYVDENSAYGIILELEKRYNKTTETVKWESSLPEEYIPLYEQCVIVEYNDKKYHTQSDIYVARIEESLLGDEIGTCIAKSDYFTYMDEILSVREISNVSSELMIAVEMEGFYYVFRNKLYGVDTLGELFACYGLPQAFELSHFEVTDEYYILNSDDAIWEMLCACADAKFVWGFREKNLETICFEATSETLGIYKNEFSISADGYVSTNMFIHEGAFFIGEEVAGKIISYAKENSQKTGYEPYMYSFNGKVLEVGKDYILMSDSVLCKESEGGMTFRIETTDAAFWRYFESGFIKEGDIIRIEFSGEFDVETGKIGLGPAFSIRKAKLVAKENEGFLDFMKDKIKTYIRRELLKKDPRYIRKMLERKFAREEG